MSKNDLAFEGDDQSEQLCEKCGAVMIEDEGEMICPHCDSEIDYFGDVEDADIDDDI